VLRVVGGEKSLAGLGVRRRRVEVDGGVGTWFMKRESFDELGIV